jgi:hypothetical protein
MVAHLRPADVVGDPDSCSAIADIEDLGAVAIVTGPLPRVCRTRWTFKDG